MNAFFRKLVWLVQRRHKEEELQEELRFHLEEEAGNRQAAGLAEREARLAARRDLGNVTLVQERTRAAWSWAAVDQLAQDLRYAGRTMVRNPAFTALAALSLALGIGANTAIYSFMDAILLRTLPVPHPESLVVLNWHNKRVGMRGTVMHAGSGETYTDPKTGTTAGIFPYPAFELMHKPGSVLASVFAYYPTRRVNLMAQGQAELASGEFVSGDYFSGLALTPAAGRFITPDDDRVGAPAIAVLGFAYAQRRFGDRAIAIGQTILINNVPFTVAGVAPPGFFGVDPAAALDFYIPLRTNFLLAHKGSGDDIAGSYLAQDYYWIEIMARLAPGVSLGQAQAALGPVFHQWVAATADNDEERANLPELLLRDGATGVETLRRLYSEPVYVLLGLSGLILAIACANIANLLLARAAARRREMAVRVSMGAGRFRVIRQLLTESLLLASVGGMLGVLFAMWGIRFLTVLLANGDDTFTLRPGMNWHVLGAALALSMITGLLFGLAPALQATRVNVIPAMKEARGPQAGSRHFLSRVLVVSQIAISLLLLVAAGLFARTLSNLQSIELGFTSENLLLFRLNARQAGHEDPEIIQFYSNLETRFAAIPGVRGVSVTQHPVLGQGTWMGPVVPAGKEEKGTVHILMTGPGFFPTMQIPILRGRVLDGRDHAGSPPVAVINESYVKTYFGSQNPLGQHLVIERRKPFPKQDVEVVGVARNARYGGLRGDYKDIVYLPYSQGTYYPVDEMTFALRTGGDPLRYVSTVRAIVHQADPRVPVTRINTQAAQIDQIMNQQIIFARLCTGFAVLALLIACVGLYGTMSYMTARRTGEIGIRVALGAPRGSVVWMVLREVLAMSTVGLIISVPAALGAAKLVVSFLYGVRPDDPSALIVATGILLGAALLAGFVPARKASRIDPMAALRQE